MRRHHQDWQRQLERRGGEHTRDGDDKAYIEFYAYVVSFGSIASGANNVQLVQVQADSDFEWRKTMFLAEPHSGTPPFADNLAPELALLVTDAGSGRQLLSAAAPLSNVAGKGNLPFIMPVTYIFEAKGTIQLTINNFSATGVGGGQLTWDNIYVTLVGNKIWRYGKP